MKDEREREIAEKKEIKIKDLVQKMSTCRF